MLSNRILSCCVGALAIGLSPIGAVAAPAALHAPVLSAATDNAPIIQVRGGGGGGGGGGGFHGGGGGFGGGGFHDGGFHGGGFHHGGFHGHRRTAFFDGPYGYDYGYEGDCWWSPRRGHWVCPGY